MADDSKLNEIQTALGAFLERNPVSKIVEIGKEGEKLYGIDSPWGDETVFLRIPPEELADIAPILNKVFLPQRLTAVWHSDSKDLEVIWTAAKLTPSGQQLADRKFTFNFGKKAYECEFGDSSAAVTTLGKCLIPFRGSDTSYRNLITFFQYSLFAGTHRGTNLDKPRSFWVREIEWQEDFIIDFAGHLNFYMSYFDDQTSKIIVHPRTEVSSFKPQHRYISGKFPGVILSKSIDTNILHFWNAAHGAEDQAKAFLYYYRLLEYAATMFVDAEARAEVRRILTQPAVLDDIAVTTQRLVLAVATTKQEDQTRITQLLKDTVDKAVLCREIDNNLDYFTVDTTFEGGFILEALLTKAPKAEHIDLDRLAKHAKDLRNALAHGRDVRTGKVILPTNRNFDLLQPWVTLMCVTAGQVVLGTPVT